jgi:endoglycosylceramidase
MGRWIWVAALCGACSAGSAPVFEQDGVLVDRADREIVLRGVNARVQGLFDVTFDDGRIPLQPIPAFSGDDCRFLSQQLGMNLLRMPVNWSGIEPQRDTWDEDYFARVVSLVDDCYAEGVYTLVDLHQDAYSKEIGEDGAPLWAIVPEPEELLQGPLEDLAERRTSPQVLAAFRSLYANTDSVADEYAEMTAELASRLVGHPGAIGLELHNEPVSPADIDALDDFHRLVADAVREVAPDLHLAFEPDSLRNFTDVAEIDEVFPFDNATYAPHLYTDVFEDGWINQDEAKLEASLLAMIDEAEEHQSALMVGEWGNDIRTEHGLRYVERSLELFDEHAVSWAFWVYEEYSQDSWGLYDPGPDDSRGALREATADLLARPFPERVSGRVERVSWDGTELVVTLSDASGWHRLTAPERVWSEPPTATCNGASAPVRQPAPGRIDVRCSGTELRVR